LGWNNQWKKTKLQNFRNKSETSFQIYFLRKLFSLSSFSLSSEALIILRSWAFFRKDLELGDGLLRDGGMISPAFWSFFFLFFLSSFNFISAGLEFVSWTGLVTIWSSELSFRAFTFLAGFNSPHNWVFLLPQNLQNRNTFLTFCFVLSRRLLMTTFGVFDEKQNWHLTIFSTIVEDLFSRLKCCIKIGLRFTISQLIREVQNLFVGFAILVWRNVFTFLFKSFYMLVLQCIFSTFFDTNSFNLILNDDKASYEIQ